MNDLLSYDYRAIEVLVLYWDLIELALEAEKTFLETLVALMVVHKSSRNLA